MSENNDSLPINKTIKPKSKSNYNIKFKTIGKLPDVRHEHPNSSNSVNIKFLYDYHDLDSPNS